MPNVQSSTPCQSMENPALLSLLQNTTSKKKSSSSSSSKSSSTGGFFKMFKLFPMLTSGCKMVALLGRPRRPLLADSATTGTLFGYRRGRVSLAIQEDPHRLPVFVIELPIHTCAFHREMAATDAIRIALESETRGHHRRRKMMEEVVWGVYCNGRKVGYAIRRKEMSEDEIHLMQLLRGVSMGAGVLPSPSGHGHDHDHHHHDQIQKENSDGDQLTYIRARFERVVGSKDSESLYMINPDGAAGPELSIFFLRLH